jgi:hypothetical protein
MIERKKRTENKVRTDYTQDDLYKFYLKDRNHDFDITKKKFNLIIKKFNRELVKLMIYKVFEFKMPYTLGILRVRKAKPKSILYNPDGTVDNNGIPINWKKTSELWERNPTAKENKKLVLHLNEHTDGYVYRFYWNKVKTRIINKESYKFKTSRSNARWLASVIKDETLDVDYFE